MKYWDGNFTRTNLTNPISVFCISNNSNNNRTKKCGINPNRLPANQVKGFSKSVKMNISVGLAMRD